MRLETVNLNHAYYKLNGLLVLAASVELSAVHPHSVQSHSIRFSNTSEDCLLELPS